MRAVMEYERSQGHQVDDVHDKNLGYEVGRYISLERLVEEHKDRYYETLERSSRGWHDGAHDPWPYINFALFVLKTACKEFEQRLGQTAAPRGEKTEVVLRAIDGAHERFRVSDLQRACPGVGLDLIRATLKRLRAERRVACLGRGRDAEWSKTKTGQLGFATVQAASASAPAPTPFPVRKRSDGAAATGLLGDDLRIRSMHFDRAAERVLLCYRSDLGGGETFEIFNIAPVPI